MDTRTRSVRWVLFGGQRRVFLLLSWMRCCSDLFIYTLTYIFENIWLPWIIVLIETKVFRTGFCDPYVSEERVKSSSCCLSFVSTTESKREESHYLLWLLKEVLYINIYSTDSPLTKCEWGFRVGSSTITYTTRSPPQPKTKGWFILVSE